MSYMALYRKWRPLLFEDVVGQSHVTQTLKNEMKSGRISHAYLFSGTRGTGKTSTAKIFSRAVNCLHPAGGNPCNECANCTGILNQTILDVAEIDAASNNSVDDIRALRDDVNYLPSELKYKIYIIDEVHMLSQSAFNALLKTLEEPPANVIFILATTEIHKIPVTILSRCQRFDFKRIDAFHIKQRLKYIIKQENISLAEDALTLLARAADGSLRDALSILDQCISMEQGSLTLEDILRVIGTVDISHLFRLSEAVLQNDAGGALLLSDGFIREGRDLSKLCSDMISHLRNLLICRETGNNADLIDFALEYLKQYQTKAPLYPSDFLIYLVQLFSKAQTDMKYAANKRVIWEISLIKACQPEITYDMEGLAARISRLEERLHNGPVVDMPASPREQKAAVEPVTVQEVLPQASTEETAQAKTLDSETFHTTYWANIKEKIQNPGISTMLGFVMPEVLEDQLYLLLDDSSYLDILKSADGEKEIQKAAKAVCGTDFCVHAMLKSQYLQLHPPKDKNEKKEEAQLSYDPFADLLQSAKKLGDKTTIIE